MKRIVIVALSLAAIASAGAYGQGNAQPTNGGLPSFTGAMRPGDLASSAGGPGWALLDPSRLRMHQSYSLSFFSGGGQSGSVGLYMNTIEYQLFKPLTVRVGLGYVHQPFAFAGNSGGAGLSNGRFLPNASLEYRPSDKFQFIIDFRTVPTTLWPYGGVGGYTYGSRYGLFDHWNW